MRKLSILEHTADLKYYYINILFFFFLKTRDTCTEVFSVCYFAYTGLNLLK